jgi:hypothetical protein
MDSLYKVISSIKSKLVKPKLYALVIRTSKGSFVSVVAEYSMEDAHKAAVEKFSKEHPGQIDPGETGKVDIFDVRTVEEVFNDFTTTRISADEKEVETRSELMKRIVDAKDVKLFEEKKGIFTEAEVKYLEGKIK